MVFFFSRPTSQAALQLEQSTLTFRCPGSLGGNVK